jgi:hypothetical protein
VIQRGRVAVGERGGDDRRCGGGGGVDHISHGAQRGAAPAEPRQHGGRAGSCTHVAAVALLQLSRLFTCSHDDEDAAGAFFVDWVWCCWYRRWILAATLTLGLFLDEDDAYTEPG